MIAAILGAFCVGLGSYVAGWCAGWNAAERETRELEARRWIYRGAPATWSRN